MIKNNIQLKEITPKIVSNEYVKWLNNYEVVKFTEQRFKKHTKKSVIEFVNEKKRSKIEFLFGIFFLYEKKYHYVGNIKLGPIDFNHKLAEISYFIGDLNFQNKGIATEAIKQVLILAKKKYKLKKILASVYSINIPSHKVLKKNGFKFEGVIKKKFIFKKKRINELIFGKNI